MTDNEQRFGKALDEDVKIGGILALAPSSVQNHCHLHVGQDDALRLLSGTKRALLPQNTCRWTCRCLAKASRRAMVNAGTARTTERKASHALASDAMPVSHEEGLLLLLERTTCRSGMDTGYLETASTAANQLESTVTGMLLLVHNTMAAAQQPTPRN